MKNTKTLVIGIMLVVLLLGVVAAKDYSLICLDRGEIIEYSKCNPNLADRTCKHDSCSYCSYVGSKGFLCPATKNPNPCNKLGLSCSSAGNATSDQTPPVITMNFPEEGEVYQDNKITLDVFANESAKWRYLDLLRGRGWKSLCTSRLTETCEKRVTLKEGQNNLTIKATDGSGNSGYYNVSFFVDETNPKIYKTLPKKGFSDGNFYVKFKEANPTNLTLFYGNESYEVDIENECEYDGRRYHECDVDVSLDAYNGEDVEYWFELTDIAGNSHEYKHYFVSVDTTPPKINNDPIFTQGEGRRSKYITFEINITEENFDEATYSYFDSRGRLKEKRLCSKLRDGICEKRKSFRDGHHDITVIVLDEAGNSIGVPVSFDVD